MPAHKPNLEEEIPMTKQYDIIIVGAGPGGIFSAFELLKLRPNLRIAMFEAGNSL